ncbi:hypothetical protein NUW58_g5433 [Xylaria curta]|uniref:Uncharacterized protein n=1 Tax=Xylaria curta TaxID=42375 RepID=A0ACC1P1K0_9PEZI|nr:hypothetical protein NUW58_g5433 [Xylaria curta]
MDPLSITTSVITLLGAAGNIYTFLQSIRHADRGLQSLVREVSTLNGYLRSIEKALEDCRDNPYALAHIDPALWKESKVALSDCQQTLDELASVFSEPKRPSRSNTLFRRARVAAELRSRAGEIASFREKISMSNLSLQTLLQVINVSLSLRGNESHDNILRELKELKDALKKSSQAATVSYSALFLNEQDNRLVHHLKGLVRAAQDFHTTASTTASTVVGSGETQAPPTDFGDDDSRSGIASRLPSMKREQIETFLSQNQRVAHASTSSSTKGSAEISPTPLNKSEVDIETRETGSSHTFSTIFTGGFSKIAQRALQQLDLGRADGLLREALKWHSSSGSDDVHHQRRLQTQLALCNLLQGNSQEAQDLILDLCSSSTGQEIVAYQLLYALALLQLHEMDFEGARENSTRLWEALQRTPHCTVLGANDAMKLLATSYQESGDSLLADAIEAELPDLRLFEPLPKMVDFLVDCEELLVGTFGLQDCSEASSARSVVSKIHNLPIAKKPSSLQMRELLLENVRSPISEGPPSDISDSLSVKADPDFEKNQPRPKKRSWSNLRAFFRPRLSWDVGSVDLYPSHNGAQDSTFKLRKKAKTSHTEQVSPQGPNSYSNASSALSLQSPPTPKSNSSVRSGPMVQNDHSSDSNTRTREWVIEQTDNAATDATTEREDVREQEPRLQRQFSFQTGVTDCISQAPLAATPISCHEMPNNAIFELMDTSPRVKLPTWAQDNEREPKSFPKVSRLISRFDHGNITSSYTTDISTRIPDVYFPSDLHGVSHEGQDGIAMAITTPLETENDIYHLLGCGRAPAKLNRRPSFDSNDLLAHTDVSMGCDSSGSDSDTSSNFDWVTRSTRQTSFDSCTSVSEGNRGGGADEDYPPQTVLQNKAQRAAEPITSNESPPIGTSCKVMDNYGLNVELDLGLNDSPTGAQTHKSGHKATNNAARLSGQEFRAHSRREFGPAVARLCQYKSPRKAVFRRRLPGSAATGLRKLLQAQNYNQFDFSFSNTLYSGPDAVSGPFTEPGLIDLTNSPDIRKLTPRLPEKPSDNLTAAEPDARHMGRNAEAQVSEKCTPLENTNEPPPHHNEDPPANRKCSWTRTQIYEFFEISQERPSSQADCSSSA